jgi:hypothetical protein
MTITRVLAQSTVRDLAAAEDWYTRVFGREPDLRPMPGLLEWHLGDTFGVQVWSEPDRAGHSSMVLDESDVDALRRAWPTPGSSTTNRRPQRRHGSWP